MCTKVRIDVSNCAELLDHLELLRNHGEGSCPCFYDACISQSHRNEKYFYFCDRLYDPMRRKLNRWPKVSQQTCYRLGNRTQDPHAQAVGQHFMPSHTQT